MIYDICSLKPNKSTGPDKIPARFLKDGATALKDQLTLIINLSITTSTVKSARVKSLFKKTAGLMLAISGLLVYFVYHQKLPGKNY